MILVTADLHLSDNARDEYRHAFMKALPGIVAKRKAEGVIILGDLTEEKDRHSAWLVNMMVKHLTALKVPVIVMRGNHDGISADEPFFGFLRNIPNMRWINDPTPSQQLGTWWHERLGPSLFLPHTRDYERDWKDVRPLFKHRDYIFAHNTFKGAMSDNGARQLDGIPTDIFHKHDWVLAGDVHKPQNIGPVTYVGAPYRVDFGDDYAPRVALLRRDQGPTFVRLDHMPQKRLVEFKSTADLVKRDNINKGDILKVRMHVADYAAWQGVREQIMEWGEKYGYHVHTAIPIIRVKAQRAVVLERAERRDDSEVLKEYGHKHGVDDKTLAVGKKLME